MIFTKEMIGRWSEDNPPETLVGLIVSGGAEDERHPDMPYP